MTSVGRDQYNAFAEQYTKLATLPLMKLESELIRKAMGDCTDARVLDLGGGVASHARTAIAAGADTIDLVDISEEMMKFGQMSEEAEGRRDKIRFLLGDVAKTLDHLNLKKHSYDLVMANWVFDHATSIADLEGMWQNIATYIKPGGRFVGVRLCSVTSRAAQGQYGIALDKAKQIPGGWSYVVVSDIDPPLSFEATSMDISLSGSLELHEKYGFGDVNVDFGECSEVVRRDPTLWAEYLADPFMAVVAAVKQ